MVDVRDSQQGGTLSAPGELPRILPGWLTLSQSPKGGCNVRVEYGCGPGGPRGLLPQGSRGSGRVEQETHLVTPPRATSQVPIIGFSALLQLVEWYQVRLRRDQQGGSSCVDPEPPLSPPAPDQGSPSPQSAPALAQLDRRIPRANPGHPQSRRGPAARSASSHPGGDQ